MSRWPKIEFCDCCNRYSLIERPCCGDFKENVLGYDFRKKKQAHKSNSNTSKSCKTKKKLESQSNSKQSFQNNKKKARSEPSHVTQTRYSLEKTTKAVSISSLETLRKERALKQRELQLNERECALQEKSHTLELRYQQEKAKLNTLLEKHEKTILQQKERERALQAKSHTRKLRYQQKIAKQDTLLEKQENIIRQKTVELDLLESRPNLRAEEEDLVTNENNPNAYFESNEVLEDTNSDGEIPLILSFDQYKTQHSNADKFLKVIVPETNKDTQGTRSRWRVCTLY